MTIQTLHGDCRAVLQTLPAGSVQCVVTSPPYYGLRKYGDDPREIGQEATPALYVAALVDVFREVRRVLRDDGVVWLNLGDSYASTTSATGARGGSYAAERSQWQGAASRREIPTGLKEKDLMGIPWRVAFALQDDGWFLRSDIIWHKPNCMPESVTDRPTRAHEYVFLLSKQARYFYDAAAISEPVSTSTHGGAWTEGGTKQSALGQQKGGRLGNSPDGGTRNKRTVWTISTQSYSGAHYATMPEALIAPCVLAGSSAQACEHCGAAWGRVVERIGGPPRGDHRKREDFEPDHKSAHPTGTVAGSSLSAVYAKYGYAQNVTIGFAPRCACPDNTGSARSVVLDPFGGSGTVGLVAMRYQRDAVLIELNQDYIDDHIETRTDGVQVELFV